MFLQYYIGKAPSIYSICLENSPYRIIFQECWGALQNTQNSTYFNETGINILFLQTKKEDEQGFDCKDIKDQCAALGQSPPWEQSVGDPEAG